MVTGVVPGIEEIGKGETNSLEYGKKGFGNYSEDCFYFHGVIITLEGWMDKGKIQEQVVGVCNAVEAIAGATAIVAGAIPAGVAVAGVAVVVDAVADFVEENAEAIAGGIDAVGDVLEEAVRMGGEAVDALMGAK